MKTNQFQLYFYAIATLVLFTFSGCTKEDSISLDGNDNLRDVSSISKKINAEITVSPSGDASGVTDVVSIETALAALSTGEVLLLDSGTFYINRTIIAPVGFNGTVRGVGMDDTQINPVGDDGVPYGLSLINFPGGPVPIPSSSLLFFPDPTGTLNVSNFTATLPDAFATEINVLGSQDLTSFITISFENNEADTNLSDLRLVGTEAHPTSSAFNVHQPIFGVQVLGNGFGFPTFVTGGTHTLSGCSISKVGLQASIYQLLKEAQITVSDNYYSDVKQTNYRFLDGCNLDIIKNDMTTATLGAVVVTQEGAFIPGASNSVRIRNNKVTTAGFAPIEIGSTPAGGASFDLLIEKNKLTNLGFDPLGILPNFSGIAVFDGNDGAIVQNNQIRGEAEFGIRTESSNGSYRGNNLEGLNPLAAGYGIFGDNNTFIGIGNSTVIDNGLNNTITGMKLNARVSIEELLQEALAKRKELLDIYNNY